MTLPRLLILMLFIVAALIYKPVVKHYQTYRYDADAKAMETFLESWSFEEKLASSTPRIALAPRISELRKISKQLDGVELKTSCLESAKPLLSTYMDSQIETIILFMQDYPAIVIQAERVKSNAAFAAYLDKFKECNPRNSK